MTEQYIALQDFDGQIGMRRMHFTKGDIYELEPQRAASYVLEGLIRTYQPVQVAPAPAPKPKKIARPKVKQ